MKIRRNKPYKSSNQRKMTVNVAESFKGIQKMNDKAIKIVSKRM